MTLLVTTLTLVAERSGATSRRSDGRSEQLVTLPEPEFERFFLRHYDQVVRTLTAMTGDEQAAHDCAQEAFVKAADQWQKVRRFENPVGWVRRVAINRSRDLHRADVRRSRREEKSMPAEVGRVSESTGLVDGSLLMVDLLRLLPLMQRSTAALFYIDDLPVAEIGRLLGISTGAVKFHLSRARKNLRQAIVEEGQDLGR